MSNAVIDRDLLCRGCGYNLRGLLPTGSCPECATEIAVSLIPSSLSQSKASDFRLTDAGALMILIVCCWEIISKVGWILKLFHAAPGQVLWFINLVCSNPRMMVLISLLQVVALFAFSALARSQFRQVMLVLGLLLSVMEIPFAIGNRWDKEITVLAEAFIAIVFYPQWLGYAARMAAAAGDGLLCNRFVILRWTLPGVLVAHLIVYLSDFVPMIVSDIPIIFLIAWMIPLILRLRTALHRITPSDDWSAPVPTPKPPAPDLARQDKRWLWRVHAGLVMESIVLGVVLIFPIFAFVNSRLENLGMPGIPTREMSRGYSHAAVRMLLFAILEAAQLVCVWWISWPAPHERPSGPAARLWLRFFAAVALAVSMGSVIYAILGNGHSTEASGFGLLLHGAMLFCLFLFIEKDLAVRAADEDVRRQAAMLKWLLPLVIGGEPAIVVVGQLLGLINPPAALALSHLGRMLIIVSCVWGIWIIYWLSQSFARALATPLNPGDVI
jgi:hypothetical protein